MKRVDWTVSSESIDKQKKKEKVRFRWYFYDGGEKDEEKGSNMDENVKERKTSHLNESSLSLSPSFDSLVDKRTEAISSFRPLIRP